MVIIVGPSFHDSSPILMKHICENNIKEEINGQFFGGLSPLTTLSMVTSPFLEGNDCIKIN